MDPVLHGLKHRLGMTVSGQELYDAFLVAAQEYRGRWNELSPTMQWLAVLETIEIFRCDEADAAEENASAGAV